MAHSHHAARAPLDGAAGSPGHFPTLRWLPLLALLALGLNLRSPLTAVPPVIAEMRAALGMNEAVAGLLTSIPALCFGLMTPVAALLVARRGVNAAVTACLCGALLGLALRPWGGVAEMVAGTFLVGASLAIGNIVALVLIARDFSDRRSMVTGLYTASLNVGTMITGALTAPLATAIGWQAALASWGWLAILALLCSLLAARLGSAVPVATPVSAPGSATTPRGALWRRPILWLLCAGFSLHLFIYYALTAWLPTYLADVASMSPERAGLVSSTFQVTSLAGSFAVPVLARYIPLGRQLAVMGVLWTVTVLGLLLLPAAWPAWALTGGTAQGGAFVVLFLLIMQSARDLGDNRRLSAASQGVGYTVSALGPIVMGFLHGRFGWTAGFACITAASLALLFCGLLISRREPARATS